MLVERHGEISAPTLCLWGVHDPWQTIRDGERLSREIPDARLVVVDDGHLFLITSAEESARQVSDFLGASR